MHLRPLIRSDLSELADVAAAAFYDDEFHQWLQIKAYEPGKEQSRRRIYFEANKKRFIDNNIVGIGCVEVDKDDPSKERILGYAWWQRHGPSDSPTQRAYTSTDRGPAVWVERNIEAPLKQWYERWVAPNRLVDHKRLDTFIAMATAHNWNERVTSHWYCQIIAVRPEAQGKGVATMILKWAQDRADQEGIVCTLEASVAGGPVYRKRGFKCVDWSWMESALELKGGDCMIYDPNYLWTRELRPGEQDYIDCAGEKRKIDIAWKD